MAIVILVQRKTGFMLIYKIEPKAAQQSQPLAVNTLSCVNKAISCVMT